MIEIINKIEKAIYAVLMVMLILVLVAAMVDLAWVLITDLTDDSSPWLLDTHEMLQVLGGFLLVLISVPSRHTSGRMRSMSRLSCSSPSLQLRER